MPAQAAHFLDHSLRLTFAMSAFGFMILEYFVSWLTQRHNETHDFKETLSSLSIASGRHAAHALEAGLVAVPFSFAYEHRIFNFAQTTPAAIVALFFAVEFVYYWHHRFSHSIRWMWATHAVHHSPTKLNMTAAIRLGWTGNVSGNFLFFLPLVLLGFHPLGVAGMLGLNLFYQFFIHTEFAPRLGPLEWVLNTPLHHQVHHATNAACLDKNFGGVLIIFDRLFDTFAEAPKSEALRYGLVGTARTDNPLRILFGEWAALARDVMKAPTLAVKLRTLFVMTDTPAKEPRNASSPPPAISSLSPTLTAGE